MSALALKPFLHTLDAPLLPLYVIHGQEDLLRIEALDALRQAAKKQGFLNREQYVVDSANFDWSTLLIQAASSGLFSDLKLLEIHLPTAKPSKTGIEALLSLASFPPEETCTVIVLPKLEKAQLQAKWFIELSKTACVMEAKAIGANELPEWIRSRLADQELAISDEALSLFADLVEGNLLAAKQEVDKLALLHPKGYTVQLPDAEQAVANVARFDVFQLSSAWMTGDVKRVVRLLEGLEAKEDYPVVLVGILAEDIRTLLRLAAALKEGKSVAAVRYELRLWGDKQTCAPMAVKRLKPRVLMNALQTCAQIDREIKGVQNADSWATFKHLVVQLAS